MFIVGSNFGEVFLFIKNQLYDKSVCLNILKMLIVFLFKRLEDVIGYVVKDLKDVGVKIFIVGIGGENDFLEMSDLVLDIQNILILDENYLDILEIRLVLKLC